MAEQRREPRYGDFGISSLEMLPAYMTGTEEDVTDALAISRQYAKESKLEDEDRVEDSLRHILFGGLIYGNPEEEGALGRTGRNIAGYLADAREGNRPEDLIDIANNEYGRKLRQQYPDREEFIAKAKEVADALAAGEELPEIEGVSPELSYGRNAPEMAVGGLMGTGKRAAKALSPTAAAVGLSTESEEAEAAYIPLSAFREGTEAAKKVYQNVKKLLDEGIDDAPGGELYQRTGAYRSEDGDIKIDVAELRARDLEMARAVGEFAEDANFFINNPKRTRREIKTPISKYLPENSPIFENFPELKDVKVVLRRAGNKEKGTYGYYAPYSKEIHILFSTKGERGSINDPVKAFNTLVHEFQHHIQDVKGAANTGFNTVRTGVFMSKMKSEIPRLRQLVESDPDNVLAKQQLEQYEGLLKEANVDADKFLSGDYAGDVNERRLRRAIAENSVGYEIYVRELGEAEARSSGRKAFLTEADPARKEIGVFYPATSEDPGTLEAVKIGSEKALPREQILVRTYPGEQYKEANLEFVDPQTKQKGSNKLSAAGVAGAGATGLASMPSEALADALGISRERTSVLEQMDIADQDSAISYLEGRMAANPETVGTAPSDVLEDAPIVGDVVGAADILYMVGEANKMEPGEEQPEAVDEFSGMERDISGMATGGLMQDQYNQLNPIPQQFPPMEEQQQSFINPPQLQMRQGGGVETEAGKEMAKEKFQLDREKADLNNDGELSEYEKTRGEAVQRAMGEGKETKMAMGGGMMGDPFAPFQVHIGMDGYSGNDIPAGSKAEEVRDDIPAMLSEGEYVVPADVVRWHGLKTFEGLRCEAKHALGLMAMHDRISFVDDETKEKVEYEDMDEEYEIEEDDKPEVEEAEVKVIKAQEGTSVEPLASMPTYFTRTQINPQTGRYEFIYVDPETGQQISQEEFDASRSTRFAPESVIGREVYGRGQEPECPEGYVYDADIGACVPEDGAEEAAPVSVTTPTVSGGDGGGDGGGVDVGSPPSLGMSDEGVTLASGETIRSKDDVFSYYDPNYATTMASINKSNAMLKDAAVVSPVITAVGAVVNNVRKSLAQRGAAETIRAGSYLGVTPTGEYAGWRNDMSVDLSAAIGETEREASQVVSGERGIDGSSFGTRGEAEAVANAGWGSDDHFDAIEASFEATRAADAARGGVSGDASRDFARDFGGITPGDAPIEGRGGFSYDIDTVTAGVGTSDVGSPSRGSSDDTGFDDGDVGGSFDPGFDEGDVGDTGSSSDSGGSYCCTKMVKHGVWQTRREFAMMHKWHREQPQWWRDGYDVWGNVVAETLLKDNHPFWTSVMQSFYDHHVKKKPHTAKSILANAIIYPGVAVYGTVAKFTGRHVNAL